jgi:hypothetical protein
MDLILFEITTVTSFLDLRSLPPIASDLRIVSLSFLPEELRRTLSLAAALLCAETARKEMASPFPFAIQPTVLLAPVGDGS